MNVELAGRARQAILLTLLYFAPAVGRPLITRCNVQVALTGVLLRLERQG